MPIYRLEKMSKVDMLFRDDLTRGVMETQFGVPPFRSLKWLMPVRPTMVSTKAPC